MGDIVFTLQTIAEAEVTPAANRIAAQADTENDE